MLYYALLTLDLNNAEPEERSQFYDELHDNGWTQIDSITTAWWKEFPFLEIHTLNVMVEDELNIAMNNSNIDEVDYVIQFGEQAFFAGKLS